MDQLEREGDIISRLEDHVLTITLNRPEALNALTLAMRTTLQELFMAAKDDDRVRVIVLTGTGRGFCSGADAGNLSSSTGDDMAKRMSERRLFTPRHCLVYKPTICAVNGICAGAGLHFVSDCDIVIAADNATFTDPHVDVGQITAFEPVGLARRMPMGPVLRMMILGKKERLTAEQARDCFMVSEVVPADQLMARAQELAAIATTVSPGALQASLKAFWEAYEPHATDYNTVMYETVMRFRDHPDAKEGPAAFMAKRKPNWA
jgi:enoyl-CoA hydratase/carnithine racemase